MKRVTYLLKNDLGEVHARMTLPEEENVSLEPWMVHNINTRGWRLEAWEPRESGVQIHGWADWQSVAVELAKVVEVFLDSEAPWDDEQMADEFLGRCQSALDGYHVAQMEVAVASVDAEPQTEGEEPDGQA